MDKKTFYGAVISIVGFLLIIVAVGSYINLMERVGWYLDMFPSSTRYNQEIFYYQIIGLIGVILTVAGVMIATSFKTEKEQKVIPINKATNILYERYAKGEINKEQFEQMKKDLER